MRVHADRAQEIAKTGQGEGRVFFPGPDDVHRYGGRNGNEEISKEESNGFKDRQEKNSEEGSKAGVPEQGGEQNEDKHSENKKGAE